MRKTYRLRLRQGFSTFLAACLITCSTNLQAVPAYAEGTEGEGATELAGNSSNQGNENKSDEVIAEIHSEKENNGSGSEGGSSTESDVSVHNDNADNGGNGSSSGSDTGSGSSQETGEQGGSAGGGSESGSGESSSEQQTETNQTGETGSGSEGTSEGSGSGEQGQSGAGEGSGTESGSTEGQTSDNAGSLQDATKDVSVHDQNTENVSGSESGTETGSDNASETGSAAETAAEQPAETAPAANSGSASGSAGGGSAAGSAGPGGGIVSDTAAGAPAETGTIVVAEPEDPEGPVVSAKKAETGNSYRSILAGVYGATELDENGDLIVPEIRLIGRLPEGAYAVAYHQELKDAEGLPEGQFVLESYDITIYDQNDTSYEPEANEPIMVEYYSPVIDKAADKHADLYVWHEDNWDGSMEEVARAGRELDKDEFFSETKDGEAIEAFNITGEGEDEEDIPGALLGFAVAGGKGAINASDAVAAGTGIADHLKDIASASDYTEEEDEEMTAEEKAAEELYKSFDKIRLDKKAYKFEYTGFGVYAVVTDQQQLRPITEQELEAEVYTGADLLSKDNTVDFKVSGQMPEGAIVKAWPAEIPAELADKEEDILLGAYEIGIFYADGTKYEPEADEDGAAEEQLWKVEMGSETLKEAKEADRRVAVLWIPAEGSLDDAEILAVTNAMNEAETEAKLAEIREAREALDAESREAFDTEADYIERYGIEPVELEGDLADSVSLTRTEELDAQIAMAPAAALKELKSANKAVNSVQNGKAAAEAVEEAAAEDETAEVEEVDALEELLAELPDNAGRALRESVFAKEDKLSLEAEKCAGTYLILATPDQKEPEYLNQILEAAVYTDSSRSETMDDVIITVRGDLPADASAVAYPVAASNGTSDETLAAYQIHIYDKDGKIFHSTADDGRSIIVTIFDPVLAEMLTDTESSRPVRGWHKEEDDVLNMAYAVMEDGSVRFRAEEF